MTKLRVGLVGCGRMGAKDRPELRDRFGPNWLPLSHAEAVAAVPEFSLVACCDVDHDLAAAAAARFGAKLVYSDYSAMLREASLDVLCVATRADVRPEILRAAAEAGVRGIHCEKPLAQSVALASAAVRALEAANVAFSYGTLRTYMPVFRRARSLAQDGALGELQSLIVKFGRTALMWNHPHSVGLLTMFAGSNDVEFVQANMMLEREPSTPRLIDEDPLVLSATVKFANGVAGHIVDEGGLSLDVAGTKGRLSVIGDGSFILRADLAAGLQCDPTNWIYARDLAAVSGRTHAMLELRDALLSGKPTTLQPADALAEHRILIALMQSHLEGGRRIRVDDVDPDLVVTGRTGGRAA